MIDKQTELWFSQPMIGTIGDVTILPIPPDHLERFKKLWQGEVANPCRRIEALRTMGFVINGVPTYVKYNRATKEITIP